MADNRWKLLGIYLILTGLVTFALPLTATAAVWYVNDGAQGGDTFCSAVGFDTQIGSAAAPKRTITAVMALAALGDTVYVDAGTYSETVDIDTDYIAIIGADSALTVIDPAGDSEGAFVYGIFAVARNGLLIKNLSIYDVVEGIDFSTVNNSRIENVAVTHTSLSGIVLWASDNNVLTANTCSVGYNYGISLQGSSGNVVSGNACYYSRDVAGIAVELASNNNLIYGNTSAYSDYGYGVSCYASDNNTFRNNICYANWGGIQIDSGNINNIFIQNTIDSCGAYSAYIGGAAGGDSLIKCNILTPALYPDSGVFDTAAGGLNLTRNWWGTTDSAVIRAKLTLGNPAGSFSYMPFRLGMIDTAINADTVAPAAPAGVSAWARSGACTLTWSASTTNEEPSANPVGLAGYRIYRSRALDTSYWAPVGTTAAGVTSYCDNGLVADTFYYYRVTAFDNHAPWPNESWYSAVAAVIDASGPNAWYVNDTLATNDSFCSAGGSDANHGFSPDKPKLSLAAVFSQLTAGDTVYLDAGWYPTAATLTCSGMNDLWLIGADSRTTRVDAEAHFDTVMVFRNLRNLTVANLNCIYGAPDGQSGAGIALDSVAAANIINDSFILNDVGLMLLPGCDSVTVHGCAFSDQFYVALDAYAAVRVAVSGSWFSGQAVMFNTGCDSASFSGCTVVSTTVNADGLAGAVVSGNTLTASTMQIGTSGAGCTGATVTGNTVSNGKIVIGYDAVGCLVTGNTVNYPGDQCFEIGGDSNTITGNTATGAGGGLFDNGFRVESAATGNYFSANTAQGKNKSGFLVQGDSNWFDSNTVSGCAAAGIRLTSDAETNVLRGNVVQGGIAAAGFSIEGDNNALERNFAGSNGTDGFDLYGQRNILVRNYADRNAAYALRIQAHGAPNTFWFNNFVPSAGKPDSGVVCDTTVAVDLRRAWWSTTDSSAVRQRLTGSGAATMQYLPYRLGRVDTGAGADSIAPAAPLSVTVSGTGMLACTLAWSAPAGNEDIGGGAPGDLAGYRVYRSTISGTSYWLPIGTTAAGDTDYVDTTAGYAAYYYRVTAYDSHDPWPNESFYSDSIVLADMTPPDTSGPNAWYVNIATGDTSYLGLSPATPKKYLSQIFAARNRPVSMLTQGDTVYIAAGTYADTISIDTDYVGVIGADSLTTTIDYGDSSGLNPGPAGISADTRTGITIRGLGVTNILRAIRWRGVTDGRIENTWLRHCGRSGYGAGIDVGNCTTVVINNNFIYWCGNGMDLFITSGLTVTNNLVDSNCTGGIFADLCPAAVVTGNTIRNNWGSGLESIVDCDDWYVANNTVTGNQGTGIYSDLSDRGRYVNNVSAGNGTYGYELYWCNEVRFISSRAADNRESDGQGYLLWRCDSVVVSGCDIDSNGAYAVYVDSGTADVVTKCNLAAGLLGPDSVAYTASPDSPVNLVRNWWGTTDSVVIRGRIHGPGAALAGWLPFRLGVVDTAVNADTIAPAAPDSVTVSDSSWTTTSCTLVWTASNTSEEIGGGAPGDLAGYRVYRSRISDTSYWVLVGSSVTATVVDSGLVAGDTYYYRVTAIDNHNPWPNESWYSDSVVVVHIRPKPGDFVSSGASANVVDLADLAYLNAQVALYWGMAPGDPRCDLSGDGILDFNDIAILAVLFGT